MTQADTNTMQVEVEAVQKIMKDEFGADVSSADVRVAAKSEFIENREIAKQLKKLYKDNVTSFMREAAKLTKKLK